MAGHESIAVGVIEQPVRVLLIEDDEDDYILTRDLLAEIDNQRFQLEWLDSFDAARAALARQDHDIYLLDYRLGERSGLDLLREAEHLGCQAPIIVLTGQGSRDIDLEAMQAGAACYLAKAKIDAPLLERSIRYALQLKRAEQSLRAGEGRLRAILDNTIDGVITIDAHGRIESFNPAAAKMFGYRVDEVIGQNVAILMPAPYCDEHAGYVSRYLSSGEPHIIGTSRTMVGRRKDGTTFPLDLSVSEVNIGGQPTFIGMARDATERQRAEEQLRQFNADLERRVRERTAQLEATNKELEAFGYSVSHDLRAPLRAIEGFSRMILEDYADKLDEQGQHYLSRVCAGTQRMGQLIDALLALSRVVQSEMHVEAVDLSALAEACAAELQKTRPERHVEFVIAQRVVARGDARLLRVVLENLLGNAWKYTSKHSAARIELGVHHDDGAEVYFVRDDGAGFDAAFNAKLFGAFQRLHGSDEFEGSGIGLATVQRIVHRHGGRVWGEGAVEQGATFFFTLGREASA